MTYGEKKIEPALALIPYRRPALARAPNAAGETAVALRNRFLGLSDAK